MKPGVSGHTTSKGRGSVANASEKRPGMTERKKQAVIEQLWLHYYNDTLYTRGVITEEQRNRMRVKIKNRAAI